jgi:flavodoxin/Pyruvate/2-oxoacid:ferredoxin oxidoreductase delta subunit
MKIGIVYFSGTGSTARFATEITQGFRERNHTVYLSRFDRVDLSQLMQCEIIGFGSPTYNYNVVRKFLDFLKALPGANLPYFLFVTCGGQPGYSFFNMYHILHKKGWIFLNKLLGVGCNNIRAWRPNLNKPAPLDQLNPEHLAKARDFAQVIESDFSEIVVNHTRNSPKLRRNFVRDIWYALMTWPWMMRQVEGRKKVDLNLCTRCGLCANQICVSGSITLTADNTPQINNNTCVGCGGCVNLCPQLAISSSLNRNRHPFTIYATSVLKPPK